ncbi:hypothetical protein PoB_000077200 [Plakobranchus ocellatus]|uniref:Uncharacterized protein n=1 Tax=Plakobranchus ocellatus TaxID=259542 RepID=A0AAV3XUV0_9GAST|nr:hypothetical protein PoB_000077200 [Plakobranchus ocellatus]
MKRSISMAVPATWRILQQRREHSHCCWHGVKFTLPTDILVWPAKALRYPAQWVCQAHKSLSSLARCLDKRGEQVQAITDVAIEKNCNHRNSGPAAILTAKRALTFETGEYGRKFQQQKRKLYPAAVEMARLEKQAEEKHLAHKAEKF